jgi:hypothetical protein
VFVRRCYIQHFVDDCAPSFDFWPEALDNKMTTLFHDEKLDRAADVDVEVVDSDQDSTTQAIKALIQEDHGHEIKLRTMSWQRAAWLLAGDQVCLAIMAQSWSLSYVSFTSTFYLHR